MNGDAAFRPVVSTRRLLLASAAALVAAVLILFVAILPAEYGIDPLGTGRALGLIPPAVPAADAAAPASSTGGLVPAAHGPAEYYSAPFATDQATFLIGPYDYVEYKYRLEAGAHMTFAWKASSDILHDFHADPDGAGDHTEVSFDNRPLRQAFGTHAAPVAGMHGWMWENPGGTPVTVTIASAGYYSSAIEFRPNRRQIPHAIRSALE